MQNRIVQEARSYLGTRWVHQGRTKFGLDCAGLIIRVANDLGLSDFDVRNYGRRAHNYEFLKHFLDQGLYEISDPKPADIMITKESQFPCHCGFIAEKRNKLSFIHAYMRRKEVVEDYLEPWLDRKVAFLRFPGVNN